MNKKGFTLAELLGVIIVIAIIMGLAIPSLVQTIRESKGKLSKANENIIFSATDLYLSNNVSEFPKYNGSTYCITLNELIDSGDLLEDLIDVNTNTNFDTTKIVKVDVDNGIYKKKIVEINECDRYVFFDYNTNLASVKGMQLPRCITDNYTCSLDSMKAGLPVMVNVNSKDSYKFYIINDNDGLLTLILADNYGNLVNYSTNSDGPILAIKALPNDWINVINQGIIYDNNLMIDYTGYSARLPMANEIAKLSGYNNWEEQELVDISTFLKENISTGYWTSTIYQNNNAWVLANTLNKASIASKYYVRPVINIYKSAAGVGPSIEPKNNEIITISLGESYPISSTYFNISSNGASNINSISCFSSINGNVDNTSTLSKGNHIITCSATNQSNISNSNTIELKVN